MNNIPPKLRKEMSADSFYKECCLKNYQCAGKVEWHHVLIFAGKQLQKKFAIVPACKDFHHKFANRKDIRDQFLKVVLNRATNIELKEISKATDYLRLRKTLNDSD